MSAFRPSLLGVARCLALALVLPLWACPGGDAVDFDGDGTADALDCAPEDPAIHPEAPDPYDDGIDSDCDGVDGTDDDGDGYASPASGGDDCNDDDFTIHPGAEEIADDSVDQDCDGEDLVCNRDGDSMTSITCGGQDCDDTNNACTDDCGDSDGDGRRICDGDCDDSDPFRHPDLPEVCDGLDNDCDLSTTTEPDERDDDHDGWLTCVGGFVEHGATGAADQPIVGSGDCDDEDPRRFPANPDVCDGIDNDCDGVVDQDDPDSDSDGFAACLDCDDEDPSRFPGAGEACDGLDSDCDPTTTADGGETDADADGFLGCEGDCDDGDELERPGQTWYPDGDLDGYGDLDVIQTQCARPAGYVAVSGDCDDGHADVFPGSPETCDGADTDCDGVVPADEADADGDGALPCTGDCDDDSAVRSPIHPELCDGLDNDCDLSVPADEADDDGDGFRICGGDCDDGDDLEYPGQNWFVDLDGDGFGGGTLVVACAQPAAVSLTAGDCDDDSSVRFPGNPEICDGLDNDCDFAVPVDEADDDGDGARLCDSDCDDDDGARFPGNPEICDSVDNDCDLTVPADEVDADADGALACLDCDDDDASRSPGSPELCDGLDNDCDAATTAADGETDTDADGFRGCEGDCDDGDAEERPGQTWYPDFDGDGFGNLNVIQTQCARPAGYLSVAGDCDDTDDEAFPGNPEACDGVDNDCDGALPVDEADSDGDGYRPCDGDCDDAVAVVFPGGVEECDGFDNDCDAATGLGTGDEVDADGDRTLRCSGFLFRGAVTDAGETILGGSDCDDAEPHRFPGNPEVCDGLDNDCNAGSTVPGEELDADGDRYLPCHGFVDNGAQNDRGEALLGGGDCVDDPSLDVAGAVHPRATPTEACDGFDTDCSEGGDGTPEDLAERDADGDGRVTCAAYVERGRGYVGGGDCGDDDPDNWTSCGTCIDTDGDGHFVDCDRYSTVEGPDCADDDADLWASCGLCGDLDLDGWFAGCDAYATRPGPDCSPTDARHWQDCAACADADSDGFGVSCDLGADCADDDPNNWVSCGSCLDGDGDVWFVGCDRYYSVQGPDCDDEDDSGARIQLWYTDADGDGHGTGVGFEACEADPPLGLFAPDDSDCDDGDYRVYGGALELPGDGVDNSCGGGDDLLPSDATGVFVDGTGGDDGGPGTMAAPVATVTRGIELAQAQGVDVFVAEGEYGESVTLAAASLFGGYDPSDWSRDIGAHVVELGSTGACISVVGGGVVVQGVTCRSSGITTGVSASGGDVSVVDVAVEIVNRNSAATGIERASAAPGRLAVLDSSVSCTPVGSATDELTGLRATGAGDLLVVNTPVTASASSNDPVLGIDTEVDTRIVDSAISGLGGDEGVGLRASGERLFCRGCTVAGQGRTNSGGTWATGLDAAYDTLVHLIDSSVTVVGGRQRSSALKLRRGRLLATGVWAGGHSAVEFVGIELLTRADLEVVGGAISGWAQLGSADHIGILGEGIDLVVSLSGVDLTCPGWALVCPTRAVRLDDGHLTARDSSFSRGNLYASTFDVARSRFTDASLVSDGSGRQLVVGSVFDGGGPRLLLQGASDALVIGNTFLTEPNLAAPVQAAVASVVMVNNLLAYSSDCSSCGYGPVGVLAQSLVAVDNVFGFGGGGPGAMAWSGGTLSSDADCATTTGCVYAAGSQWTYYTYELLQAGQAAIDSASDPLACTLGDGVTPCFTAADLPDGMSLDDLADLLSLDAWGNPRPVDGGTGRTTLWDRGAHEYQPSP